VLQVLSVAAVERILARPALLAVRDHGDIARRPATVIDPEGMAAQPELEPRTPRFSGHDNAARVAVRARP
jgi:hypothetical protein